MAGCFAFLTFRLSFNTSVWVFLTHAVEADLQGWSFGVTAAVPQSLGLFLKALPLQKTAPMVEYLIHLRNNTKPQTRGLCKAPWPFGLWNEEKRRKYENGLGTQIQQCGAPAYLPFKGLLP